MATDRKSLMTPPGVLSFPAIFSPKAPAENAEPRYSIVLVFDKVAQATPEFKALKAGAHAVAKDKWGDKMPNNLRSPFRDGAEKDYDGYGEGKIFISAWTKTKPGVVDAALNEILVAGDVWAGQIARATVTPFAYETSGNKGISFGLNNIQILKTDTPRLDGRRPANKDFTAVGDAVDADEDAPF